ncbi:MAG: 16S rRNA (cytosine(1402)-N(4))-methyltransferase [Planctomycetes bacterium]|nr:16S rRNA (cytosine(1402)-N(4))-methyltransferase [Planctomycetota bacterium]
MDSGHEPVLLDKILAVLQPMAGDTYVDLTIGRGGHAQAMAEAVGPSGLVVGFDLDRGNLEYAMQRLGGVVLDTPAELGRVVSDSSAARSVGSGCRAIGIHAGYAQAASILGAGSVTADLILADVGFSSVHVDDPERGFSFQSDGPLDMRYDRAQRLTAAMIVNETEQEELANLIYRYGEERMSRKIAAAIVANRNEYPIETTARLAHVVRDAVPGGSHRRGRRSSARPSPSRRRHGIDPATRTFQAIRIVVNDELGSLERLMEAISLSASVPAATESPVATTEGEWGAARWLSSSARAAIISFHSLEDRIVKQAVNRMADGGGIAPLWLKDSATQEERDGDAGRLECTRTRRSRVITADDKEIDRNPRSRPAKMRAWTMGRGQD